MTIGQRWQVLDQGWVELQDVMGSDLAIVNAARTSYLGESKGDAADKNLLFYLLRNQHTTPFEMCEVKLRIHAPLVTFWQWVRHRTFHYQSVNSQSGRYTAFEDNAFYTPDVWRLQAQDNKQASVGELSANQAFRFTQNLQAFYQQAFTYYEDALRAGIAREQARLFLPGFAVYYTWVVKVDLHNLLGFLRLRMAPEAQYEIRVYAETIYHEIVKPLFPWTAEAFERYVLNLPDVADLQERGDND